MVDTADCDRGHRLRRCILGLVLAWVLFSLLFLWGGKHFWLLLSLAAGLLGMTAWAAEPTEMRAEFRPTHVSGIAGTLVLGLISAAILYAVFFVGNLAARTLLPFGGPQIEAVYDLGQNTPRSLVAALLITVVGPGEEIFWRGYVQRRLAGSFGDRGIVASVLAYGAAHVLTGNLMLILAALVCGAFWAFLYDRYRSLYVNMVSHGAWAATIFVLFPMG